MRASPWSSADKERELKIAVLGAGALGCAMGSCLSEAGHEVWLINRNAEHVETMNRDGLTVRIQGADRRIRVRAARQAQDIAAQAEQSARIVFPAPTRGHLPLPRIRLGTEYPLGLWRAWAWWQLVR